MPSFTLRQEAQIPPRRSTDPSRFWARRKDRKAKCTTDSLAYLALRRNHYKLGWRRNPPSRPHRSTHNFNQDLHHTCRSVSYDLAPKGKRKLLTLF